jgi:hypothetical protein
MKLLLLLLLLRSVSSGVDEYEVVRRRACLSSVLYWEADYS